MQQNWKLTHELNTDYNQTRLNAPFVQQLMVKRPKGTIKMTLM